MRSQAFTSKAVPPPLEYCGPAVRSTRTFNFRRVSLRTLVVSIAVAMIAMPFLWRARESADRAHCANQLRALGFCFTFFYAEGQFPSSMQELMENADITPGMFICPSSSDKPATVPGPQLAATKAGQPGHCSYPYLGKGLKWKNDPNLVIAYEPLANHHNGMHVLFADGHVDFVPAPGILPWIAAAKGKRVRRSLPAGSKVAGASQATL